MKFFPCSNETRRGWFYVRVQRKLRSLREDELLTALEAAVGSALAFHTGADGYVRLSLQRIREALAEDVLWSHLTPSVTRIRKAIAMLETLEVLVIDPFRQANEPQGYAWMLEEPPAWRTNCPEVGDREGEYEE